MADIGQFEREYSKYFATFKETSFDSENRVSLCKDESIDVINFDKVIESAFPNSNLRPKSFDAIYIHQDNLYLIEFKNRPPAKINSKDILEKLIDGKSELDKLLSQLNIQKRNYRFHFCVVYRNCKEPYARYKCDISAKILFGLSEYKGKIVDNVITRNVDFYTKELNKNFLKELDC